MIWNPILSSTVITHSVVHWSRIVIKLQASMQFSDCGGEKILWFQFYITWILRNDHHFNAPEKKKHQSLYFYQSQFKQTLKGMTMFSCTWKTAFLSKQGIGFGVIMTENNPWVVVKSLSWYLQGLIIYLVYTSIYYNSIFHPLLLKPSL